MPDLSGFEMSKQMESTIDRLIILWFSKIDLDAGLWMQVQVTLVNARIKLANIEIVDAMPRMLSCEVLEQSSSATRKVELRIRFDPGYLSFECDDIVSSQFSRKFLTAPGTKK